MSLYDDSGFTFSPQLTASEDLAEGRFVAISSSAIVMADAESTTPVIGVTSKACTSGYVPVLQFAGTARVQAGGSVSVGDKIECATDGKGVTAGGAAAFSHGVALTAAASGEYFSCLLLISLNGPANS